jgi:SsrA-binding protein
MSEKIVSENRQARRDYEVLERVEAGIALTGTEVKSLRAGGLTLKDSYVEERRGELFLVKAHIPPYIHGNIFNHEPERIRKLLMHKHEIIKLGERVAEKRLTMIPLKVYFKAGKVKIEVGLCKGRQHADKRDVIIKREVQRDVDRAMSDAAKGRKPDDR